MSAIMAVSNKRSTKKCETKINKLMKMIKTMQEMQVNQTQGYSNAIHVAISTFACAVPRKYHVLKIVEEAANLVLNQVKSRKTLCS